MSHDADAKKTSSLPYSNKQNPAPSPPTRGQEYLSERGALVEDIMSSFRGVLPSNYVATTNGPWYSLQFQAMAEQLADIQISSTEVLKDSSYDFTRTEFLWQTLGSLVFPSATDKTGIPQITEDLAYRKFLHKMVLLLLQGAKKSTLEGGLEALDPEFIATVVERYLSSPPRSKTGAYTLLDQFSIDIFIETSRGWFPDDPFVTQQNAALVLSALKPAHVLYSYSYLFRDAFGELASDGDGAFSLDLDTYNYDDTRKWFYGAKSIVGTSGETLSDRTLFSDSSFSFTSIRPGAILRVTSGANVGRYRVLEARALLYGAYTTPSTYTLSTGGGGSLAAISDEAVVDLTRDWGLLPVDTTVTIATGPNAGTYRLDTVLGNAGGPIGTVGIHGDSVRVSPSILKVDRRMPQSLTGQAYEVDVDRLGVKVPRSVSSEDVSNQFYL